MNEITELLNNPLLHQLIIIVGIIGVLFIGLCTVVTVGDYLFRFYDHLQRKRNKKIRENPCVVIGIIALCVFLMIWLFIWLWLTYT